jgi:hypothetical protein
MKKAFILLLLVSAACSARVDGPDRARVYVPGGVVVETGGNNWNGGPPHCPPGQAKKGRC